MNYAIVFRLLGYVMLIEGALLLLPAAASWIYGGAVCPLESTKRSLSGSVGFFGSMFISSK